MRDADAIFDLDTCRSIVTCAIRLYVINNVLSREDVRVCLQGILGYNYKGSLNLFVCISFVLVAC